MDKKIRYTAQFRQFLQNLSFLAGFSLFVSFLTRFLFFWSQDTDSLSGIIWSEAFVLGFLSDLSILGVIFIPLLCLLILFPGLKRPLQVKRLYQVGFFSFSAVSLFFILLGMVMEIVFWNEFHVRANFIAVDYLVYTHEVLGNIWESYPIVWWLGGIFTAAFLTTIFFNHHFFGFTVIPQPPFKTRVKHLLLLAVLFFANLHWSSIKTITHLQNHSAEEVAKNGTASLFHAYFNNQLDFEKFYATNALLKSFKIVRAHLASEADEINLGPYDIGRLIKSSKKSRRLNVVVVSMESMSARYLTAFGGQKGLTPNLDRLAREGVLFSNVLATGTRTVRGLEAMSLSIPPTPGQSIVRRPKNQDLYNIGDTFGHAGYVPEFLYGGYSYFDNMKEFFESNEFQVWDRTSLKDSEFTFGNIWGACDEDLFKMSLRRADAVFKTHRPFFQLIMTTSNHRPYTYPQKIDIPSGTGRDGAVKYADYAIGNFIQKAKEKPWFKDTVFVFIADHDASVAGRIETPIRDYRIPFIIYSPNHLTPQVITRLGSQIDLGPTLYGLLHFSYKSHFFGHNLLEHNEDRAFISTYQTVGYLKNHVLTLLGPNHSIQQFKVGPGDQTSPMKIKDQTLIEEAIAYYQTANFLFSKGGMKDLEDDIVLGYNFKEKERRTFW